MHAIVPEPTIAPMPPSPVQQAMAEAWRTVSSRFGAYALVLPGNPSFVCQPELCTAHCCHAFSVSLGEPEVIRMNRETGMPPSDFLECEDGEPIALPLAQPFLLAREGGHCRFLGLDLACTVYAGRPNACRLYPHFVVFVDPSTGRVTTPPAALARAHVASALSGTVPPAIPLLLGHVECPGFTGPPLSADGWAALLDRTASLQHEHL